MNFPERAESAAKNLVKLKAGESCTGVFRGEILTLMVHWENNRSFNCTGEGCARCANKKPSFRFRINFVTKENSAWVVKVFEQGWKVFQALEELNKEFPLEKHWVKVTRTGNGTDTTYNILPLGQKSLLTPAADAEVEKLALNSLDLSKPQEITETIDPDDRSQYEETIPF
jgi:hypothetical protein